MGVIMIGISIVNLGTPLCTLHTPEQEFLRHHASAYTKTRVQREKPRLDFVMPWILFDLELKALDS